MDAILADRLTMNFGGERPALEEFSVSVPEGGAFGLLGPSGSGKTTVIRLLSGLLVPSSGSCRILGVSPTEDPAGVHALCGVVTPGAGMYGFLTGQENLLFFARLWEIPPQEAENRSTELLRRLELWEARETPAEKYSPGMLRRLSLARALLSQPRVLLLDEPDRDADADSAALMDGLTAEAAARGSAVFLCGSGTAPAEKLCSSFGVLREGRLLASGSFGELSRRFGCRTRARVRLQGDASPSGLRFSDGWWETDLDGEEEMPPLLEKLQRENCAVLEARLFPPTLSDIYGRCLAKEDAV